MLIRDDIYMILRHTHIYIYTNINIQYLNIYIYIEYQVIRFDQSQRSCIFDRKTSQAFISELYGDDLHCKWRGVSTGSP